MRNRRFVATAETVTTAIGVVVILCGALAIALVGREEPLAALWSVGAGLVIIVVVVWSLRRASVVYGEPRYAKLLMTAVIVKAAAAVAQYFVIQVVYDGTADANRYHEYGSIVADSIREGAFAPYQYGSQETTNLVTIVGWVYAFLGSNRVSGILVFATMSLVGAFLFDRAVRRAAPTLDLWRYSVLIYLLPTIVFWTANIGKDAWMMLMIGMVANGFSLLVAPRAGWSGMLWVLAGLAGSTVVRPHVALALVLSIAVGLVFMGVPAALERGSARRRVLQFAAIALVVAGAVFMVANAERYFGQDLLNAGSLEEVFEAEGRATEGSVIGVQAVRTPIDMPFAAVTVLSRPFPWEAPNVLAILASLESLVLIGLLGARVRPGVFLREARRSPLLVFSLSYVLLFVIVFSNIENAGIIVRQRAQVVPLVLMFAALPKVKAKRTSDTQVTAEPVPVGQ